MRWETDILTWMRAATHPALDGLMLAVSVLAPVLAVGSVVWVAHRHGRRAAWVVAAALVGSIVLSLELQFLLLRARPDLGPEAFLVPTPSFPSGHAAMAAAMATIATLGGTRAQAVLLSLGAALVMLSRIWLGHHYALDVVVGAVVGICISALLFGAYLSKGAGRPRWAWWLWPQVAVVVLASASAYLGLSAFEWLKTPGADKVLHFLLFGLLSFFVVGWLARWPARWVITVVAVLATLDELLQALSPMRTFDLGDLACTLGGIFIFGAVAAGRCRAWRAQPQGVRVPST